MKIAHLAVVDIEPPVLIVIGSNQIFSFVLDKAGKNLSNSIVHICPTRKTIGYCHKIFVRI